MPLTLTIRNVASLDNGSPVAFVLDRRGALIGRAATADWCLPDPALHISSRHCEVRFADDRYELVDHSTNGTFLKGQQARLAGPHAINQGDVFLIGGYEIEARLDDAAAAAAAARNAAPAPTPEWQGWNAAAGQPEPPPGAATPSGWGSAPGDNAPPGGSAGWGSSPAPAAAGWGASPAPSDGGGWGASPAPPPGGSPEPASGGWGPASGAPAPVASPADTSGWGAAPPSPPAPAPAGQGWSSTPGDNAGGWGASPAPAPAPPAPGGQGWAPAPLPPKEAAPVASPWNAAPAAAATPASAWSSPTGAAPPPSGNDIWGQFAASNVVDWARGGFGSAAAPPPAVPSVPAASAASANFTPPPVAAAAPPPGAAPAAVPPAAPPQVSAGSLDVLASSAGIERDKLKQGEAETLGAAGMLLRRLVSGMVVLMEARARAKSQMGAQGTSLEFDGNNPLKFARSPEQALAQLLNPPERGFMASERAIEDAFKDLQAHQMATLMAMQGALRATLERFSPAAIRARAEHKGMLAKILPQAREAELWKAYEKEFSGVAHGSDEAFMDMFAKEFRKAYEEMAHRR